MFRKYKPHKSKNRGMQRIKTIRWPPRNPMGDRLFYKAVLSNSLKLGTVVGQKTITGFTIQMNSIPDIVSGFSTFPGGGILGPSYNEYRIRGIAVTATAWPVSSLSDNPTYMYLDASSDNQFPASMDVSVVPEMRWTRYRLIREASAGAKPATLKCYYSVNKTWGPDRVVKNSANFTAKTNGSATFSSWDTPALGPFLRFGIFSMDNTGWTVAGDIRFLLRFKIYLEMFGKREVG